MEKSSSALSSRAFASVPSSALSSRAFGLVPSSALSSRAFGLVSSSALSSREFASVPPSRICTIPPYYGTLHPNGTAIVLPDIRQYLTEEKKSICYVFVFCY